MDPAELRRKNYIPTDSFPNYTIASGLTVDSGDYPLTHDAMIEALGYDGRAPPAGRSAAQSGGTKQIGVGFSLLDRDVRPRAVARARTRSSTSPAAGTRRRSRCCPPARCGC